MSRDEAIEIAKKLKALAEQSTGGEHDAAIRKLRLFCEKHGLDSEDYSTELIRVNVQYANEQERLILSNVLCLVMETDAVSGIMKDNMYSFKCTAKQYDNIKDAFAHYKKLYYEYVDALLVALVSKNEVRNTKKHTEKPFKFDEEPPSTTREDDFSDVVDGAETEKSGSADIPPDPATPPPPPPPPSHDDIKKSERIQRLMMVMEPNPWKPKISPKHFLA